MPSKNTKYRPKLSTLDDVAKETAKVYRQVRNGEIRVQDAGKITYILQTLFNMRERVDVSNKVEELEAKMDALMEGRDVNSDDEIAEAAKSLQ